MWDTISKKRSPQRISVKILKVNSKEKILKVAKEKWLIMYKGIPINFTADFLSRTRGQKIVGWETYKALKESELSTKNPIPNKSISQK